MASPIKVVHIISSLGRGGRERQLATIVANSTKGDIENLILYYNHKENSYMDEYNLMDQSFHINAKGKWRRIKGLNRALKRLQPDVVYAWGNGESVSTMLLKPFHRYKFINGSVRHGIRSQRFSHYFRTLILHLSPRIVANSKAGLRANNLKRGFVLYNGLEERFFTPLEDRISKRKELSGVLPHTPLLISVANLVPYKDYFSIINALRKVKEEGKEFQYLILGEGPMRLDIENAIEQADLTAYITILGSVQNVADYLQISDIFIHSSKGEGCSNAILEAMAAGLPVIASRTGGTPEIVSEGFGRLFEYRNSEQLFEHLLWFLNHPIEQKRMGIIAREDCKEKYSMEIMIKHYEATVEMVYNK